MGGQPTTKSYKSIAHEVFAYVGRPGPRAILKAVPPEAAHGLFAMLLHSKKAGTLRGSRFFYLGIGIQERPQEGW